MDESFCSTAGLPKFPQEEEPNDNWTIEELLHWSLDQYHTKAIEQTSQNISSLRLQCEKECEDILTMHTMAVDMAAKNKREEEDDEDGKGGKGENNNTRREEENNNPQSEADGKPSASSSSSTTNNNDTTSSTTKPSPSTIQVQVTVGPHTSSTYTQRPKTGVPCLVGRSKGKKFINNGISLHKDQEVSTTHGKFLVEGSAGLSYQTKNNSSNNNETNEDSNNGGNSGGYKFYFIDVGSTNGTIIYNHDKVLVPNERLLLSTGMELKVGNSVLKIILG